MVALVALTGGCTAPTRFRPPISSFERAFATTAEAFKASLVAANDVERALLVFRAARDGEPLAGRVVSFQRPTFSAEGIRVRLEALQAVEAFAARLSAVAEARSGTGASRAIDANVSAFEGLTERINAAAGTEIDTGSLSALTAPAGALVGLIGRLSIERRQERVIAAAIREAEGPVGAIISLLQQDARAFERLRRTAEGQILAELVVAYDADLDGGRLSNAATRQRRLQEIGRQAAKYESTVSADITVAFNEMARAYGALASYASAPSSEVVFANLTEAIDAFLVRADIAYDAARQLRNALAAGGQQ